MLFQAPSFFRAVREISVHRSVRIILGTKIKIGKVSRADSFLPRRYTPVVEPSAARLSDILHGSDPDGFMHQAISRFIAFFTPMGTVLPMDALLGYQNIWVMSSRNL